MVCSIQVNMFAILLEMHLLDACAKAFDVGPNIDILLWKQNHSAGQWSATIRAIIFAVEE